MKKKFLTNLFLLLLLNLLIKPFWIFGIECTVQNLVGSGEYGFYFSLLNFSLLFNIFLDLGITNFNNRSLSCEPLLFRKYYFNLLTVRFLLALIYGMITLTAAFLAGYEKRQFGLLVILILNQFLASLILYLRSNISGLQHYTTDSILSVLDKGIMIAISSILLWGHLFNQPFKIEWFAYIQLTAYLLTTLLILFILKPKAKGCFLSFDRKSTIRIIQKSLPYALLFFLMATYTRSDAVLLERLLNDGKIQAGIYAQSFRILDAATGFSFLFATLLLPMFSSLLAKKEDVGPLVKLGFSLILIFSTGVSFSCFSTSNSIIELIYRNDNHYSAQLFQVLILALIPISTTYIFGTLLTANGNIKQLNYMAAGAVIVNLTLNLTLIPACKGMGAAIASLATQVLTAVCQVILSLRLIKIRIRISEMMRYLSFMAMSTLAVMSISSIPVSWKTRFIATALTIGLASLITGILPVNKTVQMIRQTRWDKKT